MKIIILSADQLTQQDTINSNYTTPPETPCFDDVPTNQWYAPYICAAKNRNIINGYDDNTFKPSAPITLAEALKILSTSYNLPVPPLQTNQQWYHPYLKTIAAEKAIPNDFLHIGQKVTRAQMAEMAWRLLENQTAQPHLTAKDLSTPKCQFLAEDTPSSIDQNRIRQTWLEWVNNARAINNLPPYKLNPQLDRTSIDWSKFMRDTSNVTHTRPGTTAYYDYNAINIWFANRGLVFKNLNRATHTENIGWNTYKCNQADCTDYALTRLRGTFDYFMREKNLAYRPHYNTIMKPEFQEVGIGIALGNGKIYSTMHYGTEITSNPIAICPD